MFTTSQNKDDLKGCVITTGVSSLNYTINDENKHTQSLENSNLLLYSCMNVGVIKNIVKLDYYKVIIDFSDNNIKEIVYELINNLLKFNADIHVKVLHSAALPSHDTEQCMNLLYRLSKHKLIELEIVEKISEFAKTKLINFWTKKIKESLLFISTWGQFL